MTTLSAGSLLPDPIALDTGYNLDSLRRYNGFYVVTNPAGGSLASGSYFVRVLKANVSGVRKIVQEAFNVATGAAYYRALGTSGWGAWTDRGDVPAAGSISYTDSGDIYGTGEDTNVSDVLDALPTYIDTALAAVDASQYLAAAVEGAWKPYGGASTTVTNDGFGPVGAGGNSRGVAMANTNQNSRLPRLQYYSSASTGQAVGPYHTPAILYPGGSTTPGGFSMSMIFALTGSLAATERGFFGVTDQTTNNVINSSGASPDSFSGWNVFGVGFDDGDTNFSLYHCAGSGVPTQVDLGANYPVLIDQVYVLNITSPRGGGSMTYSLERVGTINTATGTISTNLPTEGVVLGMRCQVANGATAAEVGLDIHRMWWRSLYK